jgi:viroplasmin and RNaseH domain-containing protein
MRLVPIGLENRSAEFEFQGFDSLEEAKAFCEKNALDVERAARLHGGAGSTQSH